MNGVLNEFNRKPLQCTHDRSGIGNCTNSGEYMDGCPFVDPSGLCSNEVSQKNIDVNCATQPAFKSCQGSFWGAAESSKCFDSTLFDSRFSREETFPIVGCYRTRCTKLQTGNNASNVLKYSLEIKDPLDVWRLCQPNLQLTVEGYEGYLACPFEWDSLCIPPSSFVSQISSVPKTTPAPTVTEYLYNVDMEVSFSMTAQEFNEDKQTRFILSVATTADVNAADVTIKEMLQVELRRATALKVAFQIKAADKAKADGIAAKLTIESLNAELQINNLPAAKLEKPATVTSRNATMPLGSAPAMLRSSLPLLLMLPLMSTGYAAGV